MNDSTADLLVRRRYRLGPNVPTFYRNPRHLVKGKGVWLWDADGRKYLDAYNNTAQVGHCHPRVVEAIAKQSGTLCTHTRYLHEGILDYLDRLTSTLGEGMEQAIMTCSGSEANEVALRIARSATGRTGVIATDTTYHGNTIALSALSVRYTSLGSPPDNVRLIGSPGPKSDPDELARYITEAAASLHDAGHGLAALILCPIFANEGILPPPPKFLNPTIEAVHKAGGLFICDEVQSGFGRIGSCFWGHRLIGAKPDILTVGKPMANGYPAGAAVTSAALMKAFRDRERYFNTFGGNPVACAASTAVLKVLQDEELAARSEMVGGQLRKSLASLRHPGLSDVRGAGLFIGLEMRREVATAPDLAEYLDEGLADAGILAGRTGCDRHVLKLRPPLCLSFEEADRIADTISNLLRKLAV